MGGKKLPILISILLALILTGCGQKGIKGRYWYFVDNVKIEGEDAPEIRLWVALPMEHRGQDVKIGSIFPQPVEIIHDALNGNEICFWQIHDLEDQEQIHFYYDFEIFPQEVNTNVDPANITPYQKNSDEYLRHTNSEPWIEITPELQKAAWRAVGDEINPYHQAQNIFHWVVENMSYEYPDTTQRGAAKSFRRRKGDCGEYSFVFTAMCRAVGIPARIIICIWPHEAGGHGWAEYLLPPYGWIPVDPSMADATVSGSGGTSREEIVQWLRDTQGIRRTEPDYFFGNLYPHRMIVWVGSNIDVISQKTGIQKTFKVMQPGGNAAIPPAIELAGLSDKTVHGGFFIFGERRGDLDLALGKAQKELAFSYFKAEQYDSAQLGFMKKLEDEPEDAASWWGLGLVHMKKNDYDAAIGAFNRSIAGRAGSVKPAFEALARTSLGRCYDVMGMRQRAVREYETVIDMDVNFYGMVDSARIYLQEPYAEPEEEQHPDSVSVSEDEAANGL
jgi:hypothetical protein